MNQNHSPSLNDISANDISMNGIFVTGTDTNIGKTIGSALLLSALHQSSRKRAGYFKPVQTGLDSDTETVSHLSGVTPIAKPVYFFPEPIAPHRAASLHSTSIQLPRIQQVWQSLSQNTDRDTWVVEGAGGIMVPLSDTETMGDLAKSLDLSLVIVASTRLGTINQILLTLHAAQSRSLEIASILLVEDSQNPDPGLEEVLSNLLKTHSMGTSPPPPIIRIPHLSSIDPRTIQRTAAELFPTSVLDAWLKRKTKQPESKSDSKSFDKEDSKSNWVETDRNFVWHPFSQHGLHSKILPVQSAQGAYLKLQDGQTLLDGISSWWVTLHGHSHPRIAQAIARQATEMEHVIFSGFSHLPGVRLAEVLIQATRQRGADYSKVFYSDNGSTCVEVALKMAYQYHYNLGRQDRDRFLALHNSYHGDTLGAMAVGEPAGYHFPFRKLLPQVDFVDPNDPGALDRLLDLLTQRPDRYAAFIFEPLLQGAGGMNTYPQEFLNEAIRLCRRFDVLTIADEVFTGFYRTGKCFAFEYLKQTPDLLCLSKGITGGFLPLAVTLAPERVFSAFLSKEMKKAFLHGHSYTANPLACAAALESWTLLENADCQAKIKMITEETCSQLNRLKDHPHVKATRNLGTIGAVELKGNSNYLDSHSPSLMERAIKRGVLLRPLGKVLYSVPPYCVTREELQKIYQTLGEVI